MNLKLLMMLALLFLPAPKQVSAQSDRWMEIGQSQPEIHGQTSDYEVWSADRRTLSRPGKGVTIVWVRRQGMFRTSETEVPKTVYESMVHYKINANKRTYLNLEEEGARPQAIQPGSLLEAAMDLLCR